MKIVFFGASDFTPLVLPYLDKSFEVELIINEKNISFESIENTKAEIAVLAAFGKIIPKNVLNHFKYGILNIHPSLLPKYRGPSPVQTAILNGDKETGVTIIRLDEEIDHGPILGQTSEIIKSNDTSLSLYQRLFPLGAKLINKNAEKYVKNELKLTPQDHRMATYTKMLKREDGYFDLDNPLPLEKLELMIKAYSPWPGVWTKWNNKILKFLPEKKIQVEGKNLVNYKDFINGYPNLDKNLVSLLK